MSTIDYIYMYCIYVLHICIVYIYINILLLLSDLGNARVIVEAILLIETITPLLT